MTNRRGTSLKERIEIVYYCIAQNNDYKQTADVYNVSYEQVYQWVKKLMKNINKNLKTIMADLDLILLA
ncbi:MULTISPECIES: helix-turn-helix domain-containing protein [Clostridium]|uniref:Helix-turn-helix domain-containing protein n=1 Tax=Clostridium frigoriphilum TaxID=443253 RepID=A0ABU7UNK9_9CLOT|nr:helix-turn-helix domain-containing protein [Clostridium sp. DSM 17811]MBU3098986.1 helix-turn-helix domain containing protein [Clostridium sp. DSM 17811]